MKSFIQVFVIFFAVSTIHGQVQNINCNFVIWNNRYACIIDRVTVPDNQNLVFTIGGNHLPNRSNSDVLEVDITVSDIPFIITEIFTTFPNVIIFAIRRGNQSGLLRIQSGAFANAKNLIVLLINNNRNFREIQANAFSGASNLQTLDLSENQIQSIHETAFHGLGSVIRLFLEMNNISELHPNTFRDVTSLRTLHLFRNQLETIDGRLLQNQRSIQILTFDNNRINAIGRNFLDELPILFELSLRDNVCVNRNWLTTNHSFDEIRRDLEPCFENSVEVPETPEGELRRFVLELRGPLSLRFENGTEIVRV